MATKAGEKIIDALTHLMEAFAELQESYENDLIPNSKEAFDEDDDDDEEEETEVEVETAITNEIKAALDTVIESEDYAPEEFANLLSCMTSALEEIDPNVFTGGEDQSALDSDDDEDYDDIDEDEDLYEELDDIDDDKAEDDE